MATLIDRCASALKIEIATAKLVYSSAGVPFFIDLQRAVYRCISKQCLCDSYKKGPCDLALLPWATVWHRTRGPGVPFITDCRLQTAYCTKFSTAHFSRRRPTALCTHYLNNVNIDTNWQQFFAALSIFASEPSVHRHTVIMRQVWRLNYFTKYLLVVWSYSIPHRFECGSQKKIIRSPFCLQYYFERWSTLRLVEWETFRGSRMFVCTLAKHARNTSRINR